MFGVTSKCWWHVNSLRKGYATRFRELLANEHLTPEDLAALQRRKLGALLCHAYERIPYYRDMFNALDLRPRSEMDPEEIRRLPVLTKQVIQDQGASLMDESAKPGTYRLSHTGGSTGAPLSFYQDANYVAYDRAELMRDLMMTSYRPGDRCAYLWGSDYDSREHLSWWGRLKDRVLKNVVWMNVFDMSEEALRRYIAALRIFRPQYVCGYASGLFFLGQILARVGRDGFRPVALQSTAEVLFPSFREAIESAFGCRVFDRYGCREVGNIAHECSEHGGLHIFADNQLVEFLDHTGAAVPAGTPGRIVVTNLNNFVMPLIRYEIGDVGVAQADGCSCGRPFPLMKMGQGRVHDFILCPSGKVVHGAFFTHHFGKLSAVRQFQVIQEDKGHLTVNVVKGHGFDDSVPRAMRRMIHDHLDPRIEVDFQYLDAIPASPSGKLRFTCSHLPQDKILESLHV